MDMDHLNESLVNNIRKICKDKNVFITQMENDLGFSPGLISRWSRTKTSPSFDKVVAVMEYLGVTYEELTGNTKITSFSTLSHSRMQENDPQNNMIYETLLKGTIDGRLAWDGTGNTPPAEVSMTDLFPDWYLYDVHKYYFTIVNHSLFLLLIQYNSQTSQMYDALYLIHHQMDGTRELILEQDKKVLDLLHCINADDHEKLCNHYKQNFFQSYSDINFMNETKFKKL